MAVRREDQKNLLTKALHGRLDRLAETAMEVAIETGDPIGMELSREVRTTEDDAIIDRLQRLCEKRRYTDSVPLREVAYAVTEERLNRLKGGLDGGSERLREIARLEHSLGVRLANVGRRSDALLATQRAVLIERKLAERKTPPSTPPRRH